MFKPKQLFLTSLLFLIFSSFFIAKTKAENCQDINCDKNADNYIECNQKQQSCYQKAIVTAQSQANTLSNTIAVLRGQVNVLELQINQSLVEILSLETEIEDLTARINGLSMSLDRLGDMLIKRVSEDYKRSQANLALLLFSRSRLNNLLSEYKYLKLAERQTAQAMAKAENQRLDYDSQKKLKEEKQDELNNKKILLESQQADLAAKKQEQELLLEQTKNNEKRYQQLLAEAQKELRQIAEAANLVIREGTGVEVKKGEVIGTMGNSGYSFGDHLHFGIYKYNYDSFSNSSNWYYSSYINPLDKLGSKTILWDTGCPHDPTGTGNYGHGDWEWPMSNIRITQNYGTNTCYNYLYHGNAHPALDIVGIGSLDVRSVQDGTAYFCRNCLGDGGNGVFVFHQDDYMTLYWHLK